MMPEYVVEIYTQQRYKGRIEADSRDEAKNQLWSQLEEISPEEVADLQEELVDDIRVRELYDWEKKDG